MTELLTPEKAIEAIATSTRKFYLVDGADDLPPTFFLYRENGENQVIVAPDAAGEPWQKRLVSQSLRQLVESLGDVYMFAMFLEAWTIEREDWKPGDPPPSEAPDRKEAACAFLTHRDKRTKGWRAEIVRGEGGTIVDLKEASGNTDIFTAMRYDVFGHGDALS